MLLKMCQMIDWNEWRLFAGRLVVTCINDKRTLNESIFTVVGVFAKKAINLYWHLPNMVWSNTDYRKIYVTKYYIILQVDTPVEITWFFQKCNLVSLVVVVLEQCYLWLYMYMYMQIFVMLLSKTNWEIYKCTKI